LKRLPTISRPGHLGVSAAPSPRPH